MVTREELQLRLWGKDTTVDFDHSFGIAINKLREALGDSASGATLPSASEIGDGAVWASSIRAFWFATIFRQSRSIPYGSCPRPAGSAQRIGDVLAHDATWMPDGVGILYATGTILT